MIHKIKDQPDEEPVTLADMRQHLGINQADDTARDSIITSRIASARLMCEHYTRQAFIAQTWVGYSTDFPYNCNNNHAINLKQPLISVASVKYLDSSGAQQTLAKTAYLVDIVSACIVPEFGASWPTAQTQLNSVQVEYVCGYGDAEEVPETLKDAIRFVVGQWEVFQNSIEGVVRPFTIPNAAKELLQPYIDMRDIF